MEVLKMIRIKLRAQFWGCILAMSLIAPVLAQEPQLSLETLELSTSEPAQTKWRRARRNIGADCSKCDSPGEQSAAVTLFEHPGGQGKLQGLYGPGKYRGDRGALNGVGNNAISSLRVEPRFTVRLCESEGDGNGSGRCEEFGPGQHNVTNEMDNLTSFASVRRL